MNLFCINVEFPFDYFGVKACLSFGDVVLDMCVLIVVDCTCVTNMLLLKEFLFFKFIFCYISDRLCGIVVRVSGYRYRGLGLDSRRYQIF